MSPRFDYGARFIVWAVVSASFYGREFNYSGDILAVLAIVTGIVLIQRRGLGRDEIVAAGSG